MAKRYKYTNIPLDPVYQHIIRFEDANNFTHEIAFKSRYASAITDLSELSNATKFSPKNLDYYWYSNEEDGLGDETKYYTSVRSITTEEEHGGFSIIVFCGFGYSYNETAEEVTPIGTYLDWISLNSLSCTDTVTEAY